MPAMGGDGRDGGQALATKLHNTWVGGRGSAAVVGCAAHSAHPHPHKLAGGALKEGWGFFMPYYKR